MSDPAAWPARAERSSRVRHALTALPLVGLVLGLSACTDSDAEPDADVGGSSSVSALPSKSGSPVLPTRESADAFGALVVRLVEGMLRRGDYEEFERLSAPSCAGCEDLVRESKKVQRLILRGEGSFAGQSMVVKSSNVRLSQSGDVTTAEYEATVHVPEVTAQGSDGSVSTVDARDTLVTYRLTWAETHWLITGIGS